MSKWVRRSAVLLAVPVLVFATAVFMPRFDAGDEPPEGLATTTTIPSTGTGTTTAPPPPPTSSSITTTTLPAGWVPIGAPDPLPPAPAPVPGVAPDFAGVGVATISAGGADLVVSPGDAPFVRAHENLVLPVLGRAGEWFQVFTPCDETAWVRETEVNVAARADNGPPGEGFDLSDAVVVIDAGHGGPNIGAVGADGLQEKTINLEIALRLRDLLSEPHAIDWGGGGIYTGNDVPAVARVILTRPPAVMGGDLEAGLTFRATLANAAGADVAVSIHNNAGHEVDLDFPGSDVFYQSQIDDSRRLASILAAEFQRSFSRFDADWVGSDVVGAKSRLSPRDGQTQYYGLLRRSDVPTVIAEGAYISNPSEAVLLRTAEFQQAYAEALYRAIIRFLATDDFLPGSIDPEVWEGQAGSGAPAPECQVPAQP